MPKIADGCLHDAVKYRSPAEPAEPALVGVCHCIHCQAQSGAAFSVSVRAGVPALLRRLRLADLL